jgi:hypothetical protein
MANVLDVVLGLSVPVKLAWAFLLLWAAAQGVWFHRGRVVVLPPMAPTPRATRKPAPSDDDLPEITAI